MCLAIPCRVEEVFDEYTAVVEIMGVRKSVYLHLIDGDVHPGDYLLVHAGFAIGRIDSTQAQQTLQLYRQMMEQDGTDRRI